MSESIPLGVEILGNFGNITSTNNKGLSIVVELMDMCKLGCAITFTTTEQFEVYTCAGLLACTIGCWHIQWFMLAFLNNKCHMIHSTYYLAMPGFQNRGPQAKPLVGPACCQKCYGHKLNAKTPKVSKLK